MKLSQVHITNFKSLADTGPIQLGQINILLGRNNHGKSAFIRGVNLIQQDASVSANDIRLGEQQASIQVTLEGDDVSRFVVREITESITYAISVNRHPGNPPGYGLSVSYPEPNWNPPIFSQAEPTNFIYTYLSKRKVYAFDRQVDLMRTRAVQADLRYLVAKVARLANPDYEGAEEYTRLCNALLGFRISVQAAEDGNGQQAGIPVGRYGFIPIESMGEGVSSQLGLIADLCMADGHLFLIEEPENDVHPEALKTLLDVIVEKSERNQFIVSTHSNIVARYLGAAPESKIFEFGSDFHPNTIPTSTVREVEPTPAARMAVLRRLGYELSDFDLWEGWLILEESSAEVIIRYLVPWFVPELARVRTVAAGGTSKVEPTFEDFRRLFLFAHLEQQYRGRAWVIVDNDAEGQQIIASLQSKYGNWPADHFGTWSQADFERYYPSRFETQVREVLALPHDAKPAAKKALLDEVKAWCDGKPHEAMTEFEKSAAEVIERLKAVKDTLLTRPE